MSSILYEHSEILKNAFDKWVADLKKNKEPYGKLLAKIWETCAEDKANDSLLLYDLNDRKDFSMYYYDCGFINEIRKGRRVPTNEERWALFNMDANDSEHMFVIMNDDELAQAVRVNLVEIVECMIAFPHEYPSEFYEGVMWDFFRELNIIHSFEL